MKLFAFLAVVIGLTASGGASAATLTDMPLPEGIAVSGQMQRVVSYSDSTGQNLIVLTETNVQSKKIPGETEAHLCSKYLHAYRFLREPQGYKRIWRVTDHVLDCPDYTSIGASHQSGSLTVTDIDGDGVAEVWMAYELWCKGDVSPNTLKVIMYEDTAKHAIRGTTLVNFPGMEPEGGDGMQDSAFRAAPASIRAYARDFWKKVSGGGQVH